MAPRKRAQLLVPAGRRLLHCLTVSVCGKRTAENGWAIRFVSWISSSAIKPNASATVISSPCSGPKWNNSRAGRKRMTPARMAAVAATTHHRAALDRVKAAKMDALNERLTSTIGRDQRRKRHRARIRFGEVVAEGHDVEAGDERQDKASLQQARDDKASSEQGC